MPSFETLYDDLSKFDNVDTNLNETMKKLIYELKTKKIEKWDKYKTFWPPRLIAALKKNSLTCFFGAGLSMACGLPDWDSLLRDDLELSKEYLDEDSAKNDPLTQAQLASHKIGADEVQNRIRKAMKKTSKPSYNHFLLSAFKLRYYVTSNYDGLFEEAWKKLWDNGNEIIKILNDSDLHTYFENGEISKPKDKNKHYLFKIHGCVNNDNEQMILTRSDYRRHYRSNRDLFKTIKELLLEYHTLFMGFSHKDPEITRLVEDAIWDWEKSNRTKKQPNYYSLQFDMTNITPEIFAARGIVALSPPTTSPDDTTITDRRSYYLANALSDLHAMKEFVDVSSMALEDYMDNYYSSIITPLNEAIETLENYSNNAMQCIDGDSDYDWMKVLLSDLGTLGGQGVYLLDENGTLVQYEISADLSKTRANRLESTPFASRPYFKQARTFRKPFVSDLFKSLYNNIATFFICFPITEGNIFKGLIFSACQIGQWNVPIDAAKIIQAKGHSVILLDSNGICLLPPNQEFALKKERVNNEIATGYKKEDLLVLSRKDKLISRVMENLIPLGKDDDVLYLSSDLKYYFVVKEIPHTRWKLAIASRIISMND